MTSYTLFKSVHVACALIAYVLFVTRGVWIFSNPQRLRSTWVRIVPHGIDSLLLASAIGLVVVTGQYPGALAWLNMKIICLLFYIGLGMAAFRFCKRRWARLVAWMLAQAVFVYIVAVAVTRAPFVL